MAAMRVDGGLDLARAGAAGPQPERVVVINDMSIKKGGATGVALAGAAAVQRRGIPVTFIAGDDGSSIAAEYAAIDFVPLAGRHLLDASPLQAAVNGLYNRHAERAIADWIARHDTPGTVYHLHGWSKFLSPAIFKALLPIADRLAIHAHDYFLVCPNGGFYDFNKGEVCDRRPLSPSCLSCQCDKRNYPHKVWRSLRQEVLHLLFDLSRRGLVVPVHEGMVPLLENGGIPRERMRVLRNPVVPWRPERVPAEANKLFLFVGRLEEDKGALALARAAQRAGISLAIAGVGPLAVRLAQDHPEVELLGWQHRQQLTEISQRVRALVMPSLWRETFGLVAFEAMLSGIPALVSDRMMIAPEVVANGFGLAGDPQDERVFAALLRHMAEDDDLVARFSRSAFAGACFLAPDIEQWTDRLLKLYGSLLMQATGVPVRGVARPRQ